MPRQMLGKRTRSQYRIDSSSPSPSRSPSPAIRTRRAPLSPDPTPNSKRFKKCITETEHDDGSNKENIPPDPMSGPLSRAPSTNTSLNSTSDATNPMSSRAMRASRRASTVATCSTPAPRRVASTRVSTTTRLSARQHSPAIITPSKSIARLSLVTPPPTPDLTPLSPTKPTSLHSQARVLLRPQGRDTSPLIGRDQERSSISEFLTPFLSDQPCSDNTTSLYVSGAPGTGKTALVNEILVSMSTDARVVYVNCMSLGAKDGLTGVWDRCAEEFGAAKWWKRGTVIKMDWSERFSKLFQDEKCILVLDEIDHLVTSTSSTTSVSQLFAIAATPQMRTSLRVIGISNTHTLTHAKQSPSTRTIHFEPYTAAQMKAILGGRLAALPADTPEATKLFPPATLALLAMKIASQTGDIRTVFSVARRSLDLAVESTSSPSVTVTPAHILAAFKATNASIGPSQGKNGAETVTKVRNLGLQARFALAALLLANKRLAFGLSFTGSSPNSLTPKFKEPTDPSSPAPGAAQPSVDLTTLHGFYCMILSKGANAAFSAVGRTDFADLIGLLEGSGLAELTQGRGFGSKTRSPTKGKGVQVVCIASGVREEELVRGLVGSPLGTNAGGASVDVREEEVRHLWEREVAKMGREMKARLAKNSKKKGDFEGAEED